MGKGVSLDEYYRRLHLPGNASPADVKRAYRRLRAKYHPDHNQGEESKVEAEFKRIQEAFEILSGEREPPSGVRAPSPDSARKAEPSPREQPREHSASAGQAQGAKWSASGTWRAYGSHDGPLPARGANRHDKLYVPVEIALNGGDVPTSYQVTEVCRRCHGMSSRFTVEQCSDCGGVGRLAGGARCGACAGTGRSTRNQWCPTCQNTGSENYWKTDTVSVPAGTWDGQKLVMPGGGFPGPNGGAAGDAILSVVVLCGSDFHRDGLNLTGSLHVDFVTATLGGPFDAKVLGRDLRIVIPPNAQQGSLIRLPAHGLSDGSGNRGDLRLHLVLAMPPAVEHLTSEQRQLFGEMFAEAARRSSSGA